MVLVDVPVYAGEHLGVVLVCGEVCPRTGLITVFVLYILGNGLKV